MPSSRASVAAASVGALARASFTALARTTVVVGEVLVGVDQIQIRGAHRSGFRPLRGASCRRVGTVKEGTSSGARADGAGSPSGGLVQRRREAFELGDLPLLEVVRRRRQRLRDRRDRDVLGLDDRGDALHVRRHVLTVVDPDLDFAALAWSIDGLLVLRRDVGALGDRLGEAVRRRQLQAEVFAERLEDALAVADRDTFVLGADFLRSWL